MNITVKKHAFLEDFGLNHELQERVAFSENDIVTAELKGYDIGYEVGLTEAKKSAEIMLLDAIDAGVNELIGIAEKNLSNIDTVINDMSEISVKLATSFSKSLAQTLINKFPFESIELLAVECFKNMRNTPHFVFRVAPNLVEPLQSRLQARADNFGFTGRIIIHEDSELNSGDVRIEWADGGYEHSFKAIEENINDSVRNWLEEHMKLMNKDV